MVHPSVRRREMGERISTDVSPSARFGPGTVLGASPVTSLTGSGGTGSVKNGLTSWGPGSATYSRDFGQVISRSW